jgi:hypothetical protein
MKIHFASVRHPESNGLVERANCIIMTGIMKLIFNQPKGKWPDELIKVVWSHNTTISRSTGFTPFKLLFGDEAITPEEAKAGSIRTMASAEDEADCSMAKDAIEGIRLQAMENINKYQAETIKWRDRKVRLKNIKPGHLVLQRVANPDTVGKLQLKWEGPFLVVSAFRPRGVPGPTSKLSLRVPAQMGRRETGHKGENSKGKPRPHVVLRPGRMRLQ